MLFLFSLVAGLIAMLLLFLKKTPHIDYLNDISHAQYVDDMISQSVIDLKSLGQQTWKTKLSITLKNLSRQLGNKPLLKVIIFFIIVAIIASVLNYLFFKQPLILVILIAWLLASYFAYQWLINKAKRDFEQAFPDVLNMMVSSVSAGEGLLHSIIFVGQKLDNCVAKEFKIMGERMQIGEPVDEVLRQSCERLPYSSFQFFVITLRANINRGGQLKEVITKISRLLFDNRALEQKKMTMTSEARMSAKIVCAIPFIFLLIMRLIMPENYNFIMEDSSGRSVLYYLLGSELIGMTIIYRLLKAVK
jgi:tight adherence protein B